MVYNLCIDIKRGLDMSIDDALVMILAGGEGKRLLPLTKDRAKPAVPFGGRYRIIDFVLNNFINSGFFKIKVLTQYKSDSLNKHITRGWALSPFLNQYVDLAPAQMRTGLDWYRGTADAIYQNVFHITDEDPDYVCIFGGDHIYKMDVSQMLNFHKEKAADLSISAIPIPIEEASEFGIIEVDEDWRLINFVEKPKDKPKSIPGNPDMCLASMGNYIFNKDTLITYNLYSGDVICNSLANKCPIDIFLGTNFWNSGANKLYVYEVHVDDAGKPTVATLDLRAKEWTVVSNENLPMQLHHHSVAYDRENERHFIFGGFGDIYYSKELYVYNYNKNRLDSVVLKGDRIEPRYFSSMGYRKDDNSLYIYGGMGNESGEQIVGRQYFYDLHKVDLNNNTVSKLWEIPWNRENIVPVREMVIQDDSYFYTLCYPEHCSNTYLKLYRFAFKDGAFQILGDSIPIRSEKIKTKANLYYSDKLNKLFAVVQEFDDDDISSSVGVYSLAFPPISHASLSAYKPHSRNSEFTFQILIALLILLVIVIISALIFFIRRRSHEKQGANDKKTVINPVNVKCSTSLEQNSVKANSVYLFGEFMVRDRQNKDITYMFSTKLKQVFLSILQYSPKGGISSQRLSELFWPGKSEDKVKNSRGVAINHVRGILKEIDGIELVYDKGLFRIEYTDEFYCDYLACVKLLMINNTGGNATELIGIVSRGKFLRSIDMPEFDSFKGNLEQKLEPVLLIEIENCFKKEAYKIVVALCESLFYIDPINDEALCYAIQSLTKMNMVNEAKVQYLKFSIEYMNTMNTEYPYSFTDIQKKV